MGVKSDQFTEVLNALIGKGAYYTYINCCNCNEEEFVFIPKGTTIMIWKENRTCPNCGCRMGGGE